MQALSILKMSADFCVHIFILLQFLNYWKGCVRYLRIWYNVICLCNPKTSLAAMRQSREGHLVTSPITIRKLVFIWIVQRLVCFSPCFWVMQSLLSTCLKYLNWEYILLFVKLRSSRQIWATFWFFETFLKTPCQVSTEILFY